LWLRLVGEFEAHAEDGASVLPVSRKARALLAVIALHRPQPVRRDFAASLLWSGKPRDHAANSLRQALRELQIALMGCGEPSVLITGGGRLLLGHDVWTDIHDPAAVKWKPHEEGSTGPLLLCQNLQGLDPAFDAHLERLWKNLVFQQAFTTSDYQDETPANLNPVPFSPAQDHGVSDRPSLRRLPSRLEEAGQGLGWKIAVLPFRSLGAPLDAGLSLGLAEEISAAMARYRMPRLIATGSFWEGAGPVQDALARCRSYNLDYVISGTIQASGDRIRVTVTLLDVNLDFEVIWASRFEGTTNDLFTLQDKIASHTVAQIDPELLQRHQYHGELARAPDAAAHQTVLTAIQAIYRPDKARFLAARNLLKHAIELDPDYAAAHAWLAYWEIMSVGQGWSDDPGRDAMLAGKAAERAIILDPLDARGISIAGHVKAYMLHEVEAALALHQRAISLNPNLPIAWTLSAWSQMYSGEHKTAVAHAETAISLSPSDPHVFFAEHVAMTANFFAGNLDAAEAIARSVLAQRPGHASALKVQVAILGLLGRTEDAWATLQELKRVDPAVSISKIISRPPLRPRDIETYRTGLRLAGVAEP